MNLNDTVKKFSVWDIWGIKIGTAAFILMIAKLWSPLLSLEWYWYLIIGILAVIKPLISMFSNKETSEKPIST